MPTFPLSPFSGFKENSLQPPVTNTTITPPLDTAVGIQWSHLNKYGQFILSGHVANNPPHLPEYYPKGLKANLPNYWPIQTNGYSDWIKNNYKTEVYKPSNPYYIGSTTITDPTAAGLKPRMASPLPIPTNIDISSNEGARLNTIDFSSTKITQELKYGVRTNKYLGANTYVGDEKSINSDQYYLVSVDILNPS